MLAAALREAVGNRPTCLIRGPLAWANNTWDVAHPLDALGGDGGGGIGSGPGMAIGAALGLRDSPNTGGRLPVAVLGDGDFLMGATALWTAVHYGIPLLVVVSNNNSFFNDELHQDRMARQRNRPVANRWIGQRIADPEPDLGMLAKAQGAEGFGPIRRPDELPRALARRDRVRRTRRRRGCRCPRRAWLRAGQFGRDLARRRRVAPSQQTSKQGGLLARCRAHAVYLQGGFLCAAGPWMATHRRLACRRPRPGWGT